MKATIGNETAMLAAKLANVPRSSALPLLTGLKVEAAGDKMILTGTDLEITTKITIPALVEDEGATVLPFDRLKKVIESGKKSDIATFCDDSVKIGKASAKLLPFKTEDFPQDPVLGDEESSAVFENVPELMRQMGNALKFASNDMTRKILSTISIDRDGARLVSTNAYSLYVGSPVGTFHGEKSIEMPREVAEIVLKAGKSLSGLKVSRHDLYDLAVMEIDGGITCEVISRVFEARYPNWRQLTIENPECSCTFDRSELADGAKFIKKMTKADQAVMIRSSERKISGFQHDSGTFSYDVTTTECNDDEVRCFNVTYLLDALATSKEKTIRMLSHESNLKPSVFENPEGDKILIMPVRAA